MPGIGAVPAGTVVEGLCCWNPKGTGPGDTAAAAVADGDGADPGIFMLSRDGGRPLSRGAGPETPGLNNLLPSDGVPT